MEIKILSRRVVQGNTLAGIWRLANESNSNDNSGVSMAAPATFIVAVIPSHFIMPMLQKLGGFGESRVHAGPPSIFAHRKQRADPLTVHG